MPSLREAIPVLLSVTVVASGVVAPNEQVPLLGLERPSVSLHHGVLSKELTNTVAAILKNNTVPGYSLAIIRPGQDVEFGSWGNRTEEGDKTTPQVSLLPMFLSSMSNKNL